MILVTLPETTPVNEVIETASALRSDGGLQLGPVVVNAFDEGDDLPLDRAKPDTPIACCRRVPQRSPRAASRGVAAARRNARRRQIRLPLLASQALDRERDQSAWRRDWEISRE